MPISKDAAHFYQAMLDATLSAGGGDFERGMVWFERDLRSKITSEIYSLEGAEIIIKFYVESLRRRFRREQRAH